MSEEKKKRRGKLKRVIANIAPTLARALGGPLAGSAVEHLSRAIFGATDTDEELLADALTKMTPEQLTALKQAEQEFQAAMQSLYVDELRVHADDRANARARQTHMRDWTPTVIGALIILGFFVVLAAMVTHRLPEKAETEFSIMLGALATMTAAVVNYFFGSSSGSKEKTWLMAFPPPPKAVRDESAD